MFIRAPRFERLGPGVETLAALSGEPVLVRQGRLLAATFHPELTDDDRLHRLFLGIVAAACANPDPLTARAVS
jgi:5'-phosphate synthase pdxT subunit